MPRRLGSLVLVLTFLACVTEARAADPGMWQTPSGNIACQVIGANLRCDMRRTGTSVRRPSSCEFDYGKAFGITRRGSRGRRLCVSDFVGGPGTPTIAYGRTWRRGGFTCTVRESGLRCRNGRNHGFELRIGRQRLF